MRVFITGFAGQLGQELQKALVRDEIVPVQRSSFDVTNRAGVLSAFNDARPQVVIHAAAYTDVDGCELNTERAYLVNALGTQNVALACAAVGARLVYISTDYVFDGTKGEPYLEFDETNPLSVYGQSKLAGERYVQMALHDFYIVRTAWLFGAGRNFVKSILALAQSRSQLSIVTDECGCPTFARDLAIAIDELIRHPVYGIYHLTNEGGCSRYEFAQAICEAANRPIEIVPVTAAEFLAMNPLPARRPASAILRNFCAASSLGIRLRPWRDALAAYLSDYILA